MKLADDLELEEAAEHAAATIAAAVRALPLKAQYHGTMRFLARLKSALERGEDAPPANNGAAPIRASAAPAALPDGRAAEKPVKQVMPTPDSMLGKVYQLLKAAPRMPIKDMAQAVYGKADDATKSNVRSQLDQLRKRGVARAVDKGAWEIIP